MLNGSKKIIKVGFLSEQSSGWMGGVNYFKNLFIAISKVDNPKIVPYIKKIKDEKTAFLLNYSTELKETKGLKYLLNKIKCKITKKSFIKADYCEYSPSIDIVSHMQTPVKNKFIAWIPDFQHIHLPEMFSEEEAKCRDTSFRNLAEKSAKVILSSYDALKDFQSFTPEYAHKGCVLNFVAIPEQDIYKKTDEIKDETIKKFNLPEKYFYVPNQFWAHKNHKVVFEAISILKQKGININIIFSGQTSDYRNANYFNELMEYAASQNITENIKLLGLIEPIEVCYLIRNCISIINPSLFEGWSSTVEEAKSIGKNIILSNINVHKEQNPPKGVYFNPKSPNELAEILEKKWVSKNFGPDYELEELAQQQLEERIVQFGKNYQKIVIDALKN